VWTRTFLSDGWRIGSDSLMTFACGKPQNIMIAIWLLHIEDFAVRDSFELTDGDYCEPLNEKWWNRTLTFISRCQLDWRKIYRISKEFFFSLQNRSFSTHWYGPSIPRENYYWLTHSPQTMLFKLSKGLVVALLAAAYRSAAFIAPRDENDSDVQVHLKAGNATASVVCRVGSFFISHQ